MILTITSAYKERNPGGGNTYRFTTVTQAGVTYSPIQPAIIPFYNTDKPAITDYPLYYALSHGQYPKLTLIVYDDEENQLEAIDKPKFIMNEEGIVSIQWDLGRIESGFIILYPTA
jgi:hypothetical protein